MAFSRVGERKVHVDGRRNAFRELKETGQRLLTHTHARTRSRAHSSLSSASALSVNTLSLAVAKKRKLFHILESDLTHIFAIHDILSLLRGRDGDRTA